MNGIVITKRNFDLVASRMIKFFDGSDVIQWHSFDCGMKRHIPTDFISNFGEEKGKHIRCVYRYPCVSAWVGESAGRKYIAIRLNNDCGWSYEIGDVVKFCGNRIQTRTKFLGIGENSPKWCYDTYQLWDKSGGFKDIKPEPDMDWPIDDYGF